MSRKILLTGSRHFVALREARRLHDEGCEVYTADSVNFDYTMYSKAVKHYFRVPSVRFEEAKYIETLCKIITAYEIDEVIALGEETFYLSNNLQLIQQSCPKVCIKLDSPEKLNSLHNKWLFYELSVSLHLPVPKTAYVKSPSEIIERPERWMHHSVLKPVYSRFGYKISELSSIDRATLNGLDWNAEGGYVIQEYIMGEPLSSFSMSSDDGNVVTYKGALAMGGPGAMAAALTIETPQLLRDIDAKIRSKLNYSGQLGLDFLRTPEGKIVLLEANPRATIGRVLLSQHKIQFRIMMLHQFWGGLVPVSQWLKYWWATAWYPDTVWSWRDIRPALMSQVMCKGLGTYLRFASQHPGVGFQAYSTYDMEYNGQPATRSKAEPATKKDDVALQSLLEGLARKGMFNIIYARRPSPLLSFAHEQARLGVIRDNRQGIAYMSACSRDSYYINGRPAIMAYLSAVRKNPTYHGFIDWRLLFFDYFGDSSYFYSVMKSNLRAIRAFARPHLAVKPPRLVSTYKLMIINARRTEEPRSSQCVFKNTTGINRSELLTFINSEGRKHNFFPVVTDQLLQRLGVTSKNSFVLVRDDTIVGFAGLVDQRKWKQFIIVHYSWGLKLISKPFNSIARRLRLIAIPEQNKPVACLAATVCLVAGNDKNLYKELLYGLACETQKQADVFMLAVTTDSCHYESLQTRYNLAIVNNLYLQETAKILALDDKSVYVDALMLL